MAGSAQVLESNSGFDQAAAEAYLRVLRGQPAAPRSSAKPAKLETPSAPLAASLAPAQPGRATRRARASRTWAAVVVAIAAPVSLGLAIEYWHLSQPVAAQPDLGPVSATLRDSAPVARAEINAYAVTAPVPVEAAATDTSVAAVEPAPEHVRARSRSATALVRPAAVSAPVEGPAPDYPSYGILDPAPSSGRTADVPAAN